MDRYAFLLSGLFGYGEIELVNVVEHLMIAGGKPLTVRMSSIGGNVETGVGIRNLIAQYAKENDVDVVFDLLGWAQSTASYLTTLPGAKVVVRENTLYMLHNPRGDAYGDYKALQTRLDWILPVTENFRKAYAARAKASTDEVIAQLDAETFLIGQQIVDAGYADELVNDSTVTAVGDREAMIAHAKKEHDRLRVAAMGSHKPNIPVQPQGGEADAVTTPIKKEEGAAASGAPDAAAIMEARAKSYGAALRALPVGRHDTVQKAFDDGLSAAYFDGLVAHAEMIATDAAAAEEKAKHAAAQAAGGGVGDLPGAPIPTGTPAAVPKASGETGTTVEVG